MFKLSTPVINSVCVKNTGSDKICSLDVNFSPPRHELRYLLVEFSHKGMQVKKKNSNTWGNP